MKCYGILPMAGKGVRLQPIGFSKELYPVVYQGKHFAISEFTIRAMQYAGVDEIKLVVNPEKLDIPKYYANFKSLVGIYFYESPSLPESCLYPLDSLHDTDICLFGLPDTIFYPVDGFSKIKNEISSGVDISLGLFHVKDGSKFDSVKMDPKGNVTGVLVKKSPPLSNWIWGIWGANVKTLKLLRDKVNSQKVDKEEKLLGVGFNALAKDKTIKFKAIKLGSKYFDIGTMESVVKINKIVKRLPFTL